MKTPVTVLMAVFNGEAYLEAAIRSILAQTFRDFEFLIIDDGSSDNSLAIIEGLKDERVRLVRNEANMGLTRSLNKGLDLAEGKYIARMDADDIALPDRLHLQFDFLENNPDYGLVGGERMILQNGHLKAKRGELFADHEAICVLQLFRNGFVHSAVMMRTTMAKTLRYNEAIFATQDYEFWVRISKHTKVANLLTPLVQYRVHGASISETKLDRQMETVKAIHKQQLLQWGLQPSPEEWDIHLLIGLTMNSHIVREPEVKLAGQWLLKLLEYNRLNPQYEAAAMHRVFQYLWIGLFNRKNSAVPLRYLFQNRNHPLNRGFRTKAIIFAHSLKHNPVFRWGYALLKKG